MTPGAIIQALEARGATVRVDGSDVVVKPGSALTPELTAAIRASKPELLALLRARRRECPLCGSRMRHFILAGADLFACQGGCPGARVARRLGYPVPGCGPMYQAALDRGELRARQGDAVGLPS